MSLIIPTLLPPMSLQDYYEKYKALYVGSPIILPEGPTVKFFIETHDPHHPICGKGNSPRIDPTRAKRLEWIGFILKNQAIRDVHHSKRNRNIIFHSSQLGYVVVCSKFANGDDFKFVTHYYGHSKKFNSPDYGLYKW